MRDTLHSGRHRRTNTTIRQMSPSSNEAVPHPPMDCRQGKINNNGNDGPATAWGSDEGRGDSEIGQDGGRAGRARDRNEDAMGNNVYDMPIATNGINYPIAGAPHPINKSVRLRKCESIPPPHGATPPSSGHQSVQLRKCELIPPPHGATPPSSGQQSVSTLPPNGATPPLGGQLLVNWKLVSHPPPNGATPPSGGQQLVKWAVNDTPPTPIYNVTSKKWA